MRILLLSLMVLSLSACQLLYRLPTRQGNVIDQRDLARLRVGMTREQVKFVMGTPVASNPFRDNRWDYFGYYKSPRGETTNHVVSLFFENDKLDKLEGVERASADPSLAPQESVDIKTIVDQVNDEKRERRDRGDRPSTAPNDTSPTPQGAP